MDVNAKDFVKRNDGDEESLVLSPAAEEKLETVVRII